MHAIWQRCLLLIVITKGGTEITYELRLWMTNLYLCLFQFSFDRGQQLIILEHKQYLAYPIKKVANIHSETFRITSQNYITRNIICSPHIATIVSFFVRPDKIVWRSEWGTFIQENVIYIWTCFQLWGWLIELVSSLLGSYRGQAFSGCSNLVSPLLPCKWDFSQGTLPNFIGSCRRAE